MIKRFCAISILALVGGCATPIAPAEIGFDQLADHADQPVRLCGYVHEGRHLTQFYSADASGHNGGLVDVEHDGLINPHFMGYVCVEGEAIYRGCATDESIICTDWASDYAINVARIDIPPTGERPIDLP